MGDRRTEDTRDDTLDSRDSEDWREAAECSRDDDALMGGSLPALNGAFLLICLGTISFLRASVAIRRCLDTNEVLWRPIITLQIY